MPSYQQAIGHSKRRVLLIDLDPQGNATMGSGVDKRALALSPAVLTLRSEIVTEMTPGFARRSLRWATQVGLSIPLAGWKSFA